MSPEGRPQQRTGGEATYVTALRRVSGGIPFDDVDWAAFHERLAERAELSLARLRYPLIGQSPTECGASAATPLPVALAWWEHAARWSRLTVTGAVAASAALVMVVRATPKETADSIVASAMPASQAPDRSRAAFDSVAVGRSTAWTIESALPSASDLLIPLGKGAATP